ncbi:MAG TPA: GNAT family N-acetyltransferase [Gaiellaceae bacterium]|nr:GNAT family N-acetyltransferase [Gaiellaceae bacterium]
MAGASIVLRRLRAEELGQVAEIDRTERIDAIYLQDGSALVIREGDFSAPPWFREGEGEHSVAAQRAELEAWMNDGAAVLGAFEGERLVGVGVVVTTTRPGMAQLAFLHVTDGRRARGIGGLLSDELERIARDAGAASIVVSATPSVNTVDFYRHRGYEPMAEPLPELFEVEPEDVHLRKDL